MLTSLVRSALAGAAGTTALNAATYLDMAVRGRPASDLPIRAVEKVTEQAGHPISSDPGTRQNRLEGLGALGGIVTGVGIGVLAGLVRPLLVRLPAALGAGLLGSAAMVAANLPMTRMGLTDPTQWSVGDWAGDVVPHLAYGAVTYATARRLAGWPAGSPVGPPARRLARRAAGWPAGPPVSPPGRRLARRAAG